MTRAGSVFNQNDFQALCAEVDAEHEILVAHVLSVFVRSCVGPRLAGLGAEEGATFVAHAEVAAGVEDFDIGETGSSQRGGQFFN